MRKWTLFEATNQDYQILHSTSIQQSYQGMDKTIFNVRSKATGQNLMLENGALVLRPLDRNNAAQVKKATFSFKRMPQMILMPLNNIYPPVFSSGAFVINTKLWTKMRTATKRPKTAIGF